MRALKYSVFCLLAVVGMAVLAQQQPPPPPTSPVTPSKGQILCIKVPGYTFAGSDLTNCYLLVGDTGQAILIDAADPLDPIPASKLLVNRVTGVATNIAADAFQGYGIIRYSPYGSPEIVKAPETADEFLVYDAFRVTGAYAKQILDVLQEKKLTLKYIILTHGHMDHIGAITYLKEKTGAELLMHVDDIRGENGAKLLKNEPISGYPKDGYRIEGLSTKVDRALHDGDIISLDGMVLHVISTPGHSPGSICLRTVQDGQPILFSGDTLLHWWPVTDMFGNAIRDEQGNALTYDTGRTNFLDGSGDEALLYRMIRTKLLTLPDDTVVYPGHNQSTTIGEEKKYSQARVAPADEPVTEVKTAPIP